MSSNTESSPVVTIGMAKYMNESIFDFIEEESTDTNDIEYLINSNTYLNIKKMTKSIAMVYFTNLDNNRIDIPEEIKIYTINYMNNQRTLQNPADKQLYTLCWSDKYTIEYNEQVILTISPERKWHIYGLSPTVTPFLI